VGDHGEAQRQNASACWRVSACPTRGPVWLMISPHTMPAGTATGRAAR
jgi:hypothetical protein